MWMMGKVKVGDGGEKGMRVLFVWSRQRNDKVERVFERRDSQMPLQGVPSFHSHREAKDQQLQPCSE
jgi:hypothetical protein